jgi:hypothetical protein
MRILVVGATGGVGLETAFLFKDSIIPLTHLAGRLFFAHVVADATLAEAKYQQSSLDWTMCGPPRLSDKAYTGGYRVREGHLRTLVLLYREPTWLTLSVRKAIDSNSVGKIFGVSN